jgi:hypothetical protein
LYDSDDRLIVCNNAYKRLYPELGTPLSGTPFQTLVRNAAEQGFNASFIHASIVAVPRAGAVGKPAHYL